MIKYVSVAEMVAVEKEADGAGLTYARMMENAGRGLAEIVKDTYSEHEEEGAVGLVGPGNNGGDTLVALALLAQQGWRVTAYLVRSRPEEDPLVGRVRLAGGGVVTAGDDDGFERLDALLDSYAVLLDGVLGTGIQLPLKPEIARVLGYVSQSAALSDLHVVAVDCPSGVDCDSGEAAAECIRADLTVSMAAAKQGLLKFPAYNYVGKLQFVGIGLGEDIPYPASWQALRHFVPDEAWVRSVLPHRPLDAHKGTFGTALVVAGSLNFSGAPMLAGKAAYRAGAGLVTLAVPASLHSALAGHFMESTWLLLPEEDGVISESAADTVRQSLERVTAVLVGPGFGLQETTRRFWGRFLTGKEHAARTGIGFVPQKVRSEQATQLPPLVIDADGLKLLAKLEDWPQRLPSLSILTPHPGEMSVLTGLKIEEIQSNRLEIASRYAREWGHVVVLKGAFTLIADPGGELAVIPVATPALACAGSGDVLAGLVAGLRAQGMQAFPAAVAAAWIHAQAGLLAAELLGGTTPVLAGDVLDALSPVLGELGD